jgi:Na+/H+ antiporter NhaD/arsenite permease-like protein
VSGLLPWAAIGVFTVAYVLIATERIHRVTAALGGAGVMLALGITDAQTAFFSTESGIDWNVVFLLLGMMVIVGVLRQTGVFEYLAIWAAKRARGRPFRVMVILVVITAVASALLDNVTTVLLIAPVTLLVCDRLGVPVVPFLIAEALASNIGGTATLVGDPPNIIIASRAGLSFNDFLSVLAPLVVLLLVVFIGLCRVLFRRAFSYDPGRVGAIMNLSEREAITDVRLLVKSLVVLGAVTIAFVLHTVLHLEPAVVALLGAGVLVAVAKLPVPDTLREVEWPTLAFFIGLFVMVGGLINTGVIETVSQAAAEATGGRLLLTSMVLLSAGTVPVERTHAAWVASPRAPRRQLRWPQSSRGRSSSHWPKVLSSPTPKQSLPPSGCSTTWSRWNRSGTTPVSTTPVSGPTPSGGGGSSACSMMKASEAYVCPSPAAC